VRVAYNLNPKWAVAAGHYANYGEFRNFLRAGEQSHQIWGVVNHDTKLLNIEAGVGFGLNSASDRVTLKLMISRDLN
jgi:hypothetical protein